MDHVLHQAALGSVPRSLEDPVTSNAANVTGFLNMLVAAVADDAARDQVYNVAVGGRTDLNDLFATLRNTLAAHGCHYDRDPVYRDFRAGDVRHSQADVSKARRLLGYEPRVTMREGVALAMQPAQAAADRCMSTCLQAHFRRRIGLASLRSRCPASTRAPDPAQHDLAERLESRDEGRDLETLAAPRRWPSYAGR